MLKPV